MKLSDELKNQLSNYIAANYIEPEGIKINYIPDSDVTKGSGAVFSKKESVTLDQLMNEVGESFHDMLFYLIDKSGMNDVDVYKKANIDRKLFSKIKSNPAYHPRKNTVLALAIALELNIDDTIDFPDRT